MDRPRFSLRGAALIALSCLALLSYLAVVSFARGASVPSLGLGSEREKTSTVIVTLTTGGATASTHSAGEAVGRDLALERQSTVLEELDIEPERAKRYWLGGVMTVEATAEQIEALRNSGEVASVEPEPVVTISNFGALPHPGAGNWGVAAIGADRVWNELNLTGAGVTVGHIDTGIDAANPTVSGKVLAFRDFVNGGSQPYDDNGHGTHTASTAVGRAIDGSPVGVAPDAKLIVAKAIGASGTAPGSQLLAAAEWIADPDGNPATNDYPSVINSSWTAGNANDTWYRSVVRHWLSLGIVPVFAAGNAGPGAGTIGSPAAYPESFAVGSIDPAGNASSFSARGPIAWQNNDGSGPPAGTQLIKPDIAAPGEDILAGYFGGYLTFSGTSMAAPHVAGVAALLRQQNPNLSPDGVTGAITGTAVDLGPAGKDSAYGSGSVDAFAAALSLGASPQSVADATFARTPPSRTKARSLSYRVELTGASQYQYRVDGGPWSTPTSNARFGVALSPGRHTVSVTAVSTAGRIDSAPDSHTVVIDRKKPTADLTWKVRGKRVIFRANVRDQGVGVAPKKIVWRLGTRTKRGRNFTHRFTTRSPKRVRLIITDRAGNRRVIRRLVTPRRPTVARAKSRRNIREGGSLKVSGAAVRKGRVRISLAPVRREVSASAVITPSPEVRRVRKVRPGRFGVTLPLKGLPPGRYRLKVEALGRLGKGERAITRTVRVTAR